MGPTDLHELALEYLSACEDALNTIPFYDADLLGAPEVSFVAPGLPVFDFVRSSSDCSQLTVHKGNISERPFGTKPARINWVTLIATIARCCLPGMDGSGNPPTAAAQQAAAEQIHADAWALWNHVYNLVQGGDLFERCCGVEWGTLSPLTPSGSCGGSTLTVTVCFDGYEEFLGT